MGLSATVDLKRPAMESECQYNVKMRKDDRVGRSDSLEILERSSPPLQNGHVVGREMIACDADASMSSVVTVLNDATISTCGDIYMQGKIDAICERYDDGSTTLCGLQMHTPHSDSLPNGKGFLADSGPVLDSSAQLLQTVQGNVQAASNNHPPESVIEVAPPSSGTAAYPIESLKEPIENNVDLERSILQSVRCSVVVDQVEQIPAMAQVRLLEQESADARTGSSASESDALCEPIQESPASPDPVREVSWLPPLYVPEIPLSSDEVEEEQNSLDSDPQLMQAVLELSASVDAPSSKLSKKSTPPQVPVPVEPHSVVDSFDRVHYSRSAHGRRDMMTKRFRQGSTKSGTKVVEADKTLVEGQSQSQLNVVKTADEHKVAEPKHAEVDPNKPTTSTKRQMLLPAHDMVAGTSKSMTQLTVNTDFNRGAAERYRRCGVVSAPISAGSDRSAPTISERDLRRQSSAELGTDEQITLPTEQTLNKALDLLRTGDACLAHEHPLQPSPSTKAMLVRGSPQRKKEVIKRKTMQDRLDRIREHDALVLCIPAFRNVNTTQMAILLRRFKKYWKVKDYLSDELVEHVLNDQPKDRQTTPKLDFDKPVMMDEEARAKLRAFREASDPDATESSSEDDDDELELDAFPSTSSPTEQAHISRDSPLYRLHQMRVEFGTLQARAEYEEEECAKLIEITSQQLMQLEASKECFVSGVSEGDEERGCARCIPVKSHLRRKMLRNAISGKMENSAEAVATSMSVCDRIPAYASVDSRLNKNFSSLTAVPLRRRIDTYLRRKSMRPAYFTRLSWDRAPWTSYLQNKKGLGVAEERRKRKRDTDGDDSGVSPFRKARRNGGAGDRRVSLLRHAGNKLVRRSLDCKRNGEKMSRGGSMLAVERRSSTAGVNHGAEVSTSSESNLDLTVVGLPQKIDYKEISIPKWRRLTADALPVKAEWPCTGIAEVSCAAEISRLHLPLELNERKRFQQYRDHVASKAVAASKLSGTQSKMSAAHSKNSVASQSKLSAAGSASCSTDTQSSSYSTSTAPSPAPAIFQFDDEHSNSAIENAMVPFYDRPSVVKPYSPRSFPLPASLLHKHLT